MPNWCSNRIEIDCDTKEEIDAIRAMIWRDDMLTFDLLIPMPPVLRKLHTGSCDINGERHRIWIEDPDPRPLTPAEKAEIAATGYKDWYDWSVANWGTKWDVNTQVDDDGDATSILIQFDTAWSPPQPWVEALRKRFTNARISAFFDEPGIQSAGYY